LQRESTPLADRHGPAVGALIVERIRKLAEKHALDGAGVCVPGLYRASRGTVWAPNIPGWDDYPLRDELRSALGDMSLTIDSDRAAYILGETWRGEAAGARDAIFLAVGTGIGAGFIADGMLVRGHFGAAGEIGHLAVNLTGPRCVCGGVACLGTYVAGGFLTERVRERLTRYPDSAVLARAGGDAGRISAKDVFAAAGEDDPLARELVEEACEAVGMGIGALASLLNPEVIVITGGVAASLAPLRDDIMNRARRRTLASILDATTVRFVPTDKRTTVQGGAALVRYEMARLGREV